MKAIRTLFKVVGILLLVLIVGFNLFVLFSGRFYLYKGIADTYLKGRSIPAIDEYTIFENRKIENAVAWDWPVAKTYNAQELSSSALEKNKRSGTIAFLVIQNDSVHYEHYWDGFADTSHTNSFSMGKTFVSVLVGIAVSEGKIKSIDEAVGNYIPEFKTGSNSKLKIRHLLTMSSGIDFDESYSNPLAFPAQAYYGTDLPKLLFKYKVTEEPGKVFKYLSGNTAILGLLLEKATGMHLSNYASEKLWKPMGAKMPAYWSLDHRDGLEKAYCCFNSNARDFARFGQLYLDSGRWQGRQLVPQEYVLSSIQVASLVNEDGAPNQRYGYSWWILPEYKGHSVFYAHGILGQYIIVIPDLKMVIVRLGRNAEQKHPGEHPHDLRFFIDSALELSR